MHGRSVTGIVDRLNALDERVLPKPRVPKSPWVFAASAALIVVLGVIVIATDSASTRVWMLMFVAMHAYRTGGDYEQYRAWRESGSEVPPPTRRPDRAVATAWTALVLVVLIGSIVYNHRDGAGIDPDAAQAVVDELVERSMEEGSTGVCALAVSRRACTQILAQVHAHTGPRPTTSLSYVNSSSGLNLASYVLWVDGSPGAPGCSVTVIKRNGELRVVNPVYWMGGRC